jgi:hypothetical protein
MTAAEIAEALGMALSTVSLWLKRIGLGKRSRLDSPERRTAALPSFLTHYNCSRRHGSLGHRAPATRLNNLVGNYS